MAGILFTKKDHGRTVTAREGDIIVVRVDENPTTGYIWEMVSALNSLNPVESVYTESSDPAMGSGGKREMHFVAEGRGPQEISLQLRRPWEPPEKAVDHLRVSVLIL